MRTARPSFGFAQLASQLQGQRVGVILRASSPQVLPFNFGADKKEYYWEMTETTKSLGQIPHELGSTV